jgi:multiple sugar transport system permease protein
MRPFLTRSLQFIALLLGAVVFAYPFLWMVGTTFTPEFEIGGLNIFPSSPTLENYRLVFASIPIGRSFFVSLIVATSVTSSVLVFTSMAAYSLSKLRWRGRDAVFSAILFTMMVPFLILLIPLYTLVVTLGWTDSLAALVIPFMMSATGVLILRQSFLSIPQDLLDAARVDGCGEFRILFRIIWPLSVPALITVALLTFVGNWNEVLWPLIVVRDEQWMTMPQMVTLFAVGGGADGRFGPQLAAALLLALPVLGAYLFFQRHFIESMTATGLKG